MLEKFINFVLGLFGVKVQESVETNKKNKETIWYSKKNIMTATEINFYNKLKDILGDKYIIWPQINLAAIINKNGSFNYKRRFQTELYHNIDFGIFDKDTFELLLLIELNDNSHYKPDRKKRDENVKSLCYQSGYKIVTFWVDKPNEYEYVKNRILYYLGALEFKIDNTQELHDITNNEKGNNREVTGENKNEPKITPYSL